jgi:hypothetical protein
MLLSVLIQTIGSVGETPSFLLSPAARLAKHLGWQACDTWSKNDELKQPVNPDFLTAPD